MDQQLNTRLVPVMDEMEQQKAGYQQMDENMPLELQDKMELIENMAGDLKVKTDFCRLLSFSIEYYKY